jgi:hypothetical protein
MNGERNEKKIKDDKLIWWWIIRKRLEPVINQKEKQLLELQETTSSLHLFKKIL